MCTVAGSADAIVRICVHLVFAVSASGNWQTKERSQALKKQVGKLMMTDPISDMLTRIRNASTVRKTAVTLPMSKIKFAIAKILEAEGYVENVEQYEESGKPMLRLHVKYDQNRAPKISSLKRVSTPGRRVYVKASEIGKIRSGFGLSIISTPNGLMTNLEAKKRRLGGEVIFEVF